MNIFREDCPRCHRWAPETEYQEASPERAAFLFFGFEIMSARDETPTRWRIRCMHCGWVWFKPAIA